jgi:beta-lactamase regulating signal transducer with metallopeptidase domain
MDVRQVLAAVVEAARAADVVSGWLATYALHSTAWIVLAWWLASRRSLRLAPRVQHTVWTVALFAGFATAGVQLAGVHLAGWFTPVAGQLRLLDGARGGIASLQLLVRRDADRGTHVSFGAIPDSPIVAFGRSMPPTPGEKEIRIVRYAGSAGGPRAPIVRQEVRKVIEREHPVIAMPPRAPLASMLHAPFPVPIARVALPGPDVGVFAGALGGRTMQAAFFAAPWSLAIVVLWGTGVAVLLLRLSFASSRLDRMLRDRIDARHTLVGNALREIARQAGITRNVRLSVTDRLASPAAIPGREICLPRRVLCELTLLEQESLLAHELAHVVRRDTTWLWLARLVECIAWFQPLNRLASRRMQLAAEFAADDWAAQVTHAPLRLAKCLARVAGWLSPGSPVLAPAMAESSGSPLVQRVRRLTGADPMPNAGRARLTGLALGVVAVGMVTLPPNVVVGHDALAPDGPFGARHKQFAILLRREGVVTKPGMVYRQVHVDAEGQFDVLRIVDGAASRGRQ